MFQKFVSIGTLIINLDFDDYSFLKIPDTFRSTPHPALVYDYDLTCVALVKHHNMIARYFSLGILEAYVLLVWSTEFLAQSFPSELKDGIWFGGSQARDYPPTLITIVNHDFELLPSMCLFDDHPQALPLSPVTMECV